MGLARMQDSLAQIHDIPAVILKTSGEAGEAGDILVGCGMTRWAFMAAVQHAVVNNQSNQHQITGQDYRIGTPPVLTSVLLIQ